MKQAGVSTLVRRLRQTLCAGSLAETSDAELVGRFVATRDEAAFEALVRRHGPMVWGLCRQMLSRREDAEDAFQATFLVLVRKADRIGRREQLANWLFGVARRVALNARARRARRARHEQARGELPDMHTTGGHFLDSDGAVLAEELARLPEKYRLPLLLCGLEGMTHAEAAEQLGWPTGTVAGRLSRGRELLRARLLRRGVVASAAVLAPALAEAAVPPLLLAATVRSALAAAPVSPAVAALLHGALREAFVTRLWTTLACAAAVALTLTGAGALWHLSSATPPPAALPGPVPEVLVPATAPVVSPLAGAGGDKPAVRLPAEPTAVVLRLDTYRGPGTNLETSVLIRADGSVQVNCPWNLQGQLSEKELHDLLRFVVHEQEFFDFDPPHVLGAMMAENASDVNRKNSQDTTTIQVRLRTADREHEVSWHQLGSHLWWFPQMKRLTQLRAVNKRLKYVADELRAGGREQVEAAAVTLDGLLQPHYRLYPNARRLTAADFAGVVASDDGSNARFTFAGGDCGEPEFRAVFDVPRQGEPKIHYVTLPLPGERGARTSNRQGEP